MVLNALRFGRQFNGKAFALYALLAAAALPAPAAAHDFWIEPQIFRPAVGAQVPLRLLVGQQFKGEAALYVPEQFERYVYVGPSGERNVEGNYGDDPAGAVPIAEAGLYIVGYFSKKFEVTFDSIDEFEQYLTMEGLERNIDIARKRISLHRGIREIYSRCAKSLIQAGGRAGNVDKVLGFPLELIPENDPYASEPKLSVRLLYRDKPLEGALVVAFNKNSPTDRQRVRTDKDGRAVFNVGKPGVWLVASVHQIPTSFFSSADWESFWASLTFERAR